METKKTLGTSLRKLTARILKKKGMDKSLVSTSLRWIFEILSSCLYPKKKMKALPRLYIFEEYDRAVQQSSRA